MPEILNKKQLEDAIKCRDFGTGCCDKNKKRCSAGGVGMCIENAACTALAYREMLERARKTLQDAWDDDGSIAVGNRILETIKAIDALLGGKEDG